MRPPTIDGPAQNIAGSSARVFVFDLYRNTVAPLPKPSAAIDGNSATFWSTIHGQRNSEWFMLDMKTRHTFHHIVLDSGRFAQGYPRGYVVFVSQDGRSWSGRLASGAGDGPVTLVTFAPQTARYIKVMQTGRSRENAWVISEITVH